MGGGEVQGLDNMERPTSACRVARITLLAGEGSQSRAAYKEVGHGGVYSCRGVRSACGVGRRGRAAAGPADTGAAHTRPRSGGDPPLHRAAAPDRCPLLLRGGPVWVRVAA